MKKHIFFLVVACLSLFATRTYGIEKTFIKDYIYYLITSNKEPYTVCVSYPRQKIGFYYELINIEIPSTIEYEGKTYAVTRIESNAFYNGKMKSIKIPSSVIEIEKGAFDYCSNLKTIYVSENDTARVKEMMRGMMNIVNGKSVEMNVDDWEFIEISAVEFSTAESVAEVFGDGSAMAECVKDPTQLAAFNTFISDCGITSVESISAAQKQYAYQSFKLSEITTAPRLFEEEPVLKIDDIELSGGNLSLTISLTAGAEAIQLAKNKLAEKIRVGSTIGDITGKPTIVASPAADGTSLTFTITPPEGNQGFVKVQID